MTKTEILRETLEWYSQPNRRATNKIGNYVYFEPKTGNCCAVGRCMKKTSYLARLKGDFERILSKLKTIPFLETYKGHENQFWIDLQQWHDRNIHFNIDQTPNREGAKVMKELMKKYSEQ